MYDFRNSDFFPLCPQCGKARVFYTLYFPDSCDYFIGGQYESWGGSFRCPECGYEYLDENKCTKGGDIARQLKTAETLRKNYPPDKYDYLTEKEVVRRLPKFFTLSDINNSIYFILEGDKKYYFKKSVDLWQKGLGYWCKFNISLPSDWPVDTNKDIPEKLMKYLPPTKSKYLTEKEIVDMEKANSYFWFNKEHLDFFVLNMIYKGQRIYLKHSYECYQKLYQGMLDPKFHSEYAEYDPNEYSQD